MTHISNCFTFMTQFIIPGAYVPAIPTLGAGVGVGVALSAGFGLLSSWHRCPISRFILSQNLSWALVNKKSSSLNTHQRWQGLPSSHVIWLLLQYKHAWLTFLLFVVFFFFPASSLSPCVAAAALPVLVFGLVVVPPAIESVGVEVTGVDVEEDGWAWFESL